jgi:hypothetical protein
MYICCMCVYICIIQYIYIHTYMYVCVYIYTCGMIINNINNFFSTYVCMYVCLTLSFSISSASPPCSHRYLTTSKFPPQHAKCKQEAPYCTHARIKVTQSYVHTSMRVRIAVTQSLLISRSRTCTCNIFSFLYGK